MRKFIYVGMLSFLMFCNNTDTTVKPTKQDNTDLDDSVSPRTLDSLNVDTSIKNDSISF